MCARRTGEPAPQNVHNRNHLDCWVQISSKGGTTFTSVDVLVHGLMKNGAAPDTFSASRRNPRTGSEHHEKVIDFKCLLQIATSMCEGGVRGRRRDTEFLKKSSLFFFPASRH